MPDNRVFDKIQIYLKNINTNNDDTITQKELKKAVKKKRVPSIWLDKIGRVMNNQDMSVNNIIMELGKNHAEEDDPDHTPNNYSDGGKFRFKKGNEEQNYLKALKSVKYFIERSVEKWFSKDLNIDGESSNIEEHRWTRHNKEYDMNDGDLNEKEYAKKYNLKIKKVNNDYQNWIKEWIEAEIYDSAYDFGVILRDEDLKMLDEYAIIQINAKLVKPGQDKTTSLYNRLGTDAYTRIITMEATDSCCGGSVVPPPITEKNNNCAFVFSSMEHSPEKIEQLNKEIQELEKELSLGEISLIEYDKKREKLFELKNSSEEVKNRLAWAAFKTPNPETLYNPETEKYEWSKMSEKEYADWHNKWNTLRSMTAKDFRALLNDKEKCAEFEKDSNMSVKQIVDYIDIVETVTGKDFDDNDWSVNREQFQEITKRVNGVYGDKNILEGKSKKDILSERQKLYKYLKKNNLLLPQFEE